MSTQKTRRGIGERLRKAITARKDSLRAFSNLTGIPYRSLLQYLREERAPGADALARIAANSGIDLHYLLLGEGTPFRHPLDFDGLVSRDGVPLAPSTTRGRPIRSLDPSVVEAVAEMVADLGIEPVVLAARRGGLKARLRVLEALDRAHPGALSFEMLARTLAGTDHAVDPRDLAADLALLVHAGLVATDQGPARTFDMEAHYRTVTPLTRVAVENFADRCQHLLEAIRILATKVFPHIETRDGLGKLATATFTVSRADALRTMSEWLDTFEGHIPTAQARVDPVSVSMVLAIGVSDDEGGNDED